MATAVCNSIRRSLSVRTWLPLRIFARPCNMSSTVRIFSLQHLCWVDTVRSTTSAAPTFRLSLGRSASYVGREGHWPVARCIPDRILLCEPDIPHSCMMAYYGECLTSRRVDKCLDLNPSSAKTQLRPLGRREKQDALVLPPSISLLSVRACFKFLPHLGLDRKTSDSSDSKEDSARICTQN